jgi:hypothetical protein
LFQNKEDHEDKESYSIYEMPIIRTEEKREREFNKEKRSVDEIRIKRSRII